jgi:hypothetical protein
MMMTEHACWRREERRKKNAMLVKVGERIADRTRDSRSPAGKDW